MACLHFRLLHSNFKFQFKLGFFIFCLFFIILCCILGFWQLHRYEFKKTLLTTYQTNSTSEAKPLVETAHPLEFQHAIVQGRYLTQQTILIQSNLQHHAPGYEIFTPLEISNEKKLLLVDRGWVSHYKPLENINEKKQVVTGIIKLMNEYQFILGNNVLKAKNPVVMQKMDINEVTRLTNKKYFPFILRLDESEPHGFDRSWTMTLVIPERHLAYAVQWFLFALIIMVAYVSFCFERIRNEK